jgi:hypothetical protein
VAADIAARRNKVGRNCRAAAKFAGQGGKLFHFV